MIYILLLSLIFLFSISYVFFDKKVLAPSCVLNLVYIFSTLCTIYNIDKWGVNIHFNTYCVIIGGNFLFFLFSYIIHLYFRRKRQFDNDKKNLGLKYIEINNAKLAIYIIISILFASLFIFNVLKLAKSYGGYNNYYEMMTIYRRNTSYGDDKLPVFVTRFFSFMVASIYIAMYIFINNILCNSKKKNNYLLIIPIILVLISSLINSERTTSLNFFIYSIIITFFLIQNSDRFSKKVERKFIKKCLYAIVFFLVLFVLSRSLVGRGNTKDPVYYITFYAGGSIQLLDLYLQSPTYATYFAEEVLLGLRQKLNRLGLNVQSKQIGHLEFRSSNSTNIGNVYTAYRRYIHDFGYFGVVFFQIFNAMIFGIWYEKIKNRNVKPNIDLSVVLFAYLFVFLCKHSINEAIWANIFNLPKLIIFLVLWKFYFIKLNVKYRDKRII